MRQIKITSNLKCKLIEHDGGVVDDCGDSMNWYIIPTLLFWPLSSLLFGLLFGTVMYCLIYGLSANTLLAQVAGVSYGFIITIFFLLTNNNTEDEP